jgi:hypothetical protein
LSVESATQAAGYADLDSAITPPGGAAFGLTAGLQSPDLIEREGSKILDRTRQRIRTIFSLSNGDKRQPHLSQPAMWLRSRADPFDRRLSIGHGHITISAT